MKTRKALVYFLSLVMLFLMVTPVALATNRTLYGDDKCAALFNTASGTECKDAKILAVDYTPERNSCEITVVLGKERIEMTLNKSSLRIFGLETECFEYFDESVYCVCCVTDSTISGLIRRLKDENLATRDISFVVGEENLIDSVKSEMHQFVGGEHEYYVLGQPAIEEMMLESPMTLHAYTGSSVFGIFAEFWTSVDYSANNKVATVTQYNVNIGVLGDGCFLRKYNTQNVVNTLWTTPTSPPVGLQTVNGATYYIDWDWVGMMDVSVTAVVVVNMIPFFYPMNDSVEF